MKKQITVGITVLDKIESIGLQVFDSLYAHYQNLAAKDNFESQVSITCAPTGHEDVRVLFAHRPKSLDHVNLDNYHAIFFCHSGESIEACNDTMFDVVSRYKNAYIICNSYLTKQHPHRDQILWHALTFSQFHDYCTRPFYPQYFELIKKNPLSTLYQPRKHIKLVNGLNRSVRQWALDKIVEYNPLIEIRNSVSVNSVVNETLHGYFESPEDTEFREFANSYYLIDKHSPNLMHQNTPVIGIDGKFGSFGLGYSFIDDYFDYKIIITPERSWFNHELSMTEKSLKCFAALSLPLPLGGAKINQLYNDMGFYTAWNLLPEDLKNYDNQVDHRQRYIDIAKAIKWLHSNPNVTYNSNYYDMVKSNQVKFLSCPLWTDVDRLKQIIES